MELEVVRVVDTMRSMKVPRVCGVILAALGLDLEVPGVVVEVDEKAVLSLMVTTLVEVMEKMIPRCINGDCK